MYLLLFGVLILILQNAGIIQPVTRPRVTVSGSVDVDNTVDVSVTGNVDANLSAVAGYDLVTSKQGMFLGVSSTEKTIIPIHWGEISISQ